MPSEETSNASCGRIGRITIVGTLPPLRAISSYCEGLAMAMARHAEVEFISFRALYPAFLFPGGSQEDPSASEPAAPGLRVARTLAWYNPFGWLAAGLRLTGEVVNLQWWSLPVAPILLSIALIAKLRAIPVTTTVHNLAPHDGNSWGFRLASRLLYALSDRIIVHSDSNAQALQRLYPVKPHRILVSRMGSADFRRGRAVDRDAARDRLGLPANRKILLMLGAIRDYKGLDQALAALPLVQAQVPDVLLLVAGQPWKPAVRQQDLIVQAGRMAGVKLDLRYIPEPEIHDYLAAADILLLPYKRFEAQSGVGISALSYGLPILVSGTGSLPELVADEASILPVGDHAALAARISVVLSDPDTYCGLAADSLSLASSHSWDVISCSLLQKLDSLLSRPLSQTPQ